MLTEFVNFKYHWVCFYTCARWLETIFIGQIVKQFSTVMLLRQTPRNLPNMCTCEILKGHLVGCFFKYNKTSKTKDCWPSTRSHWISKLAVRREITFGRLQKCDRFFKNFKVKKHTKLSDHSQFQCTAFPSVE